MYSHTQNKTYQDLYDELKTIQRKYSEYRDMGFERTVKLFAEDDFYNLHLVAKEFIRRRDEMNGNEIFVDNNEDAVYDYVSQNLDSFLAPEDMPLDDDWEKGVETAVEDIVNNYTYDELMEKVGNNI